MDHKTALILIICIGFPQWTIQQSRVDRSNGKYSGGVPTIKEPSNWKTILVIVVGVLVFGAVIYGTSCFYVCKMHFFERTEKKYTKMDSCSSV